MRFHTLRQAASSEWLNGVLRAVVSHEDNAAWRKVWKRMHVSFADSAIREIFSCLTPVIPLPASALLKSGTVPRGDGWYRPGVGPIGKPGNPSLCVIDRGVQERRPLPGNQQSKPGTRHPDQTRTRQPVAQAIVCDVAQSQQLVNRGDQRGISDVVVQAVRNIKPEETAESFGDC